MSIFTAFIVGFIAYWAAWAMLIYAETMRTSRRKTAGDIAITHVIIPAITVPIIAAIYVEITTNLGYARMKAYDFVGMMLISVVAIIAMSFIIDAIKRHLMKPSR